MLVVTTGHETMYFCTPTACSLVLQSEASLVGKRRHAQLMRGKHAEHSWAAVSTPPIKAIAEMSLQ
jgi:hypothetical protein